MEIDDHGEANVDTNIKVAVRCRPLNSKERNNGEPTCAKIYPEQIVLINPDNKTEEHSFAFDLVFPEDVTQEEVWLKVGQPILGKAISGYNSTIFAYGQTGSGKTWSMQGGDGDLQGIIPRMNVSLFERIAEERTTKTTVQFLVTVSYFEIYNEVIFDLLDPSDRKKKSSKGGLEIKEHPALGVYVKGLQEIVVDTASKLSSIVDQGMKNRTVASTQMNADSSRSHSVFMITIHQKDEEDPSKNIFAKINLVDLAGSERVKSTGATGATLKEGANINKSLSALGNVINALVEAGKGKAVFIPYRNSKLTRVLQESLGGNSITSMLAAMSPAACNFDETLSTLKYANRAKAIKVKAVKNEEASAISRLNDEIRMLKEKLAQNASGNSETTGVLSEKNKQQLKELEEAVRNTWESKTKMSEEHEQERRRLLQVQQQAAQQLQSTKERSWLLLEQKGLVELTIAHVKELAKLSPSVSVDIDRWSESIGRIYALEKSAAEQYTVIQVFRSSIDKDGKQIVKISATKDGKRLDDVIMMNSLNQLKDKLVSMIEEIVKWSQAQRIVNDTMRNIFNEINSFTANFKTLVQLQGENNRLDANVKSDDTSVLPEDDEMGISYSDKLEIMRGLELILVQFSLKQNAVRLQWRDGQLQLSNFRSLVEDLKIVTAAYHATINQLPSESSGGKIQDIKELLHRINNDLRILGSTRNDTAESAFDNFNLSDDMLTGLPVPFGIVNTGEYTTMKAIIHDGTKDKNQIPKKPSISSNHCFVSSGNQSSKPLQLKLHVMTKLTSIKVGGCRYFGSKSIASRDVGDSVDSTAELKRSGADVNIGSIESVISPLDQIKLPCGIGLSDCNGEVDSTISAVGDILDWGILLKKNPPDKFLKRPPVRFLFDLFKHIADQYPGCLPSAIETADWNEVGVSKDSKTAFMDDVISFIAQETKLEAVTLGSSIISGSDPEQTNHLLQQLAVIVYRSYLVRNGNKSKGDKTKFDGLNKDASKASLALETKEKKTVTSSCIKSFNVALYGEHGERLDWEFDNCDIVTKMEHHDGVFEIRLSVPISVLSVAITPKQWINEEFAEVPAFKVELIGYSEVQSPQTKLAPILDDKVLLSSARCMEAVLSMLTELVNKVNGLEQQEKLRRQEEMKKNMEILAQEKAALAQALANEKDALMSNNQDLTEQLKKCFNQLQETTALLEKEQNLNLELEKNRVAMEEEKLVMQQLFAQLEQENAKLETNIVRLEAALENEKTTVSDLQKMLHDKSNLADSLQGDLQYAIKSRDVLEQEKDDLQHQVAVLIEERDAARSHEEELFEKLTDVTNDLEKLQESYVDIADRCNDAQDEVSELRDQLQNLQEALTLQRAAFSKTVQAPVKDGINIRSEPKPPPENGNNSHKRSAKTTSVPKDSSGRSMEFNRTFDSEGGKEMLVSADDSKTPLSKASDIMTGSQRKNVEDDYYQEDFDEFQE